MTLCRVTSCSASQQGGTCPLQAVQQPFADADRVAAVGYCFGGGGVINLMRTYPNVTDGLLGESALGLIWYHTENPCVCQRAVVMLACMFQPCGTCMKLALKQVQICWPAKVPLSIGIRPALLVFCFLKILSDGSLTQTVHVNRLLAAAFSGCMVACWGFFQWLLELMNSMQL